MSTRARLEVRLAVTEADLRAHHRVRHQVFVEEQRVFPLTDRDDRDPHALHVVAALGPLVVGAVRLYPVDDEGTWRGDRLAVLPEARRLRPGPRLVRFAVRTAGEHGGRLMVAHVQVANVAFFQHLGWERAGAPGPYHGITHQTMQIPLGDCPDTKAVPPASESQAGR